jgi:pyruvate/2-oxoglutarate dehydrogenase complex dihydrolipoamide acyltransferase (E2) component
MKVNLKLARIGMNMEEATIVKWHRAPGDEFAIGETIYEIETEKVSQEVEAPAAGTLLEIKVDEGDIAEVSDIVCVIDVEPMP